MRDTLIKYVLVKDDDEDNVGFYYDYDFRYFFRLEGVLLG
jgi:hypothetical protein